MIYISKSILELQNKLLFLHPVPLKSLLFYGQWLLWFIVFGQSNSLKHNFNYQCIFFYQMLRDYLVFTYNKITKCWGKYMLSMATWHKWRSRRLGSFNMTPKLPSHQVYKPEIETWKLYHFRISHSPLLCVLPSSISWFLFR